MRAEMKAFDAGCLMVLTISFVCLSAFAQSPGSGLSSVNSEQIYDPWKKTDEQWNRVLERPAPEDRVLKKGLLAPSDQDRTDHAAFLKQSNTGLFRLLPHDRAQAKHLKIRGGGAYYSFHYMSHEYGRGSDIELISPLVFISGTAPSRVLQGIHDSLSVGFAGADYGMMTNLGNVPLDEMTANYKKTLPVQVGATYLLRSIVYDESDVLVALRVARQDDDGSIIIAWKLLKEFTRRKLENVNVKSKCSGPIVIKSP